MPEMNGQEVAVEMRRLKPQAPIIMQSGAVDVPEKALKSVDAFIAKDRLASQLLPRLHNCTDANRTLPLRTRHDGGGAVYEDRGRSGPPFSLLFSLSPCLTPRSPTHRSS